MNSKDQTRVSPGEAPKTINPLVILLGILLFAMGMTYFIQSGSYQRDGKLVIPGSYEVIEKQISPVDLLRTNSVQEEKGAHPVSLIATAEAIPKGFEKTADLIFMVLIIGGMFGILRHSGAIDAGLERLLDHSDHGLHGQSARHVKCYGARDRHSSGKGRLFIFRHQSNPLVDCPAAGRAAGF